MKRTTIEIDEELLARAKRALRQDTTRATVEEALRQAADRAESEHAERAAGNAGTWSCLLYTSPSPRDRTRSRMPSSA